MKAFGRLNVVTLAKPLGLTWQVGGLFGVFVFCSATRPWHIPGRNADHSTRVQTWMKHRGFGPATIEATGTDGVSDQQEEKVGPLAAFWNGARSGI